MTAHLTMEQRRLARRLHAKGLSLREIGRQVGCSHEVVRNARAPRIEAAGAIAALAARARAADLGRPGGDQPGVAG
jgi:IS30 family transposase